MAANVWLVMPVLVLATAWLYFLVFMAPSDNEIKPNLHFPQNLTDLQNLAQILKIYSKRHSLYVIALFSSAYIYKQTFSIPGSAFLNLLAGALFGIKLGFPLCCALTCVGASFCYWLSYLLGRTFMIKRYPDKIAYFQNKIDENSHRLLYYLLFLRLFPASPNMVINLVSPLIGVPYYLFAITIFLGLMPYNYLCVQTGEVLASLTSLDDVFSYSMLFKLTTMAFIVLMSSFVFRRPDGQTNTQGIKAD